jgi:hypothetical protein
MCHCNAEHLGAPVLAIGAALAAEGNLQSMVIYIALAEYQYAGLFGDLVGSGLVALLDLVNFPGIVALIAPDAGSVSVYRAIESDFLSRGQMLLRREQQQLVPVQGSAQLVDYGFVGVAAIEAGYHGAERSHRPPW